MWNAKLKTKLIGGFVIVALITILVGIIGWRGVANTGSALVEAGQVRMPALHELEVINQAQAAIQAAERTLFIPEVLFDYKQVEYQYQRLAEAWQRIDRAFKIYGPLPKSKKEAILWNQFKPVWEAWKKEHERVIGLAKSGKREDALAISQGEASTTFNLAEKKLEELIVLQEKDANAFIKESIGDINRPQIIMGVTIALSTMIALFLGIILSITITREIGRVASGLADGSSQVSSASAQVASASQALAEGASEAAASLEETSASVEELSSMTKQNADNAQTARAVMGETKEIVGRANLQMNQLASAVNEIAKSSEETGKIIKTIDEIAFQTNLLALNAAVEAARAGEAGAGFAVVANEVRNLAMRAAEAAKSTAGLIEGTIQAVKKGSALADATRDAFNANTNAAMKVAALIEDIAAASSEQARGIGQISIAVSEMDKVTQSQAATAEESASASEELNAQALQMEGFVSDLKALIYGRDSSDNTHENALVAQKVAVDEEQKALPSSNPF